MGVQVIGSSGQTVNAVGQSTMAVHASVVRAVGALTAAAGATPLIRAAERSVYADTITLAATDGVIVGNGTVDLPTIASQDEDPQAFLISAVGGAITVVPHEDDEAIFGLDNQLVSEVTVEANTVLTLLRYVGVWRVIDSSAASLALGETSTTAYRGDRGKTAYDHSQVTTGNPHGTTAADIGAAATSHTHTGTQVTVDASGFNGNLTTSDDTVQEIAQKLDDLSIPAAGIPASTIDGKGELLVGAADDTVDNLPIGTNGHVLTADSAETLGVKWAAPAAGGSSFAQLPRRSGAYYTLQGGESAHTGAMHNSAGRLLAHPVWLPAGNYDRICVNTSVAAVSTWRLGVYGHNATTMFPDGEALIVDAGTVNMNSTAGLLSITTSFTIPTAGIYWLASMCDSYTATPTGYGWRGNSGTEPDLPWLGNTTYGTVAPGRGDWGRVKSGLSTGSLPGTFPTGSTGIDSPVPQILVRAA